ncbi:MAG: DUF1540 domain-containing protein [Ruthenibacterium sp.]
MQNENNCPDCQCVNCGVCCEVESCAHNDGHHCCTAEKITVKNRMAIMGEETMCETFEEV